MPLTPLYFFFLFSIWRGFYISATLVLVAILYSLKHFSAKFGEYLLVWLRGMTTKVA